jgi:tRNA modification GTPase
VIETAAPNGTGIDSLEQAILQVVFEGKIISDDALDGGGTRRLAALERAIESLRHAQEAALSCDPVDLLSIDLRGALDSMGEITGETAPNELLHAIFSRFCIGK